MPAAALVLCEGGVGEAEVVNVRMLRHVAHAVLLDVGHAPAIGPAIIAVLERDMRDDDFGESVLPALQAYRFVKEVVPIRSASAFSGQAQRAAHCAAVLDLVTSLQPPLPEAFDEETLLDHAVELRAWDRTRRILVDETIPRITGEK